MTTAEDVAPSLSQTQFLRIGFDALSRRAARWVSLIMAFALYGGAVWFPDWKRIVAATGFTVLVNLPLWWRGE